MMRKVLIGITLVAALIAGSPKNGSTTCPSSGNTPVATPGGSTKAVTYTIQAPSTNGGSVCFGGSATTTSNSPCLGAGMAFTAPPQGNSSSYDVAQVFIACTTNTDVVKWWYQ